MRMEYWPVRSPESFSRRFPGGRRRSFTDSADSIRRIFRNAACCNAAGSFLWRRFRNTASVCLQAKLLIMNRERNASHIYSSNENNQNPASSLPQCCKRQKFGWQGLSKNRDYGVYRREQRERRAENLCNHGIRGKTRKALPSISFLRAKYAGAEERGQDETCYVIRGEENTEVL